MNLNHQLKCLKYPRRQLGCIIRNIKRNELCFTLYISDFIIDLGMNHILFVVLI